MIVAGALAVFVAVAVLGVAILLIRGAGRLTRIDVPDPRRLHQSPTPRGGGLAMPFAITAAGAVYLALEAPGRTDLWVCLVGFSLPNGILGIVDDYRPIRSRVKFAIQIGLSVVFVVIGARIEEVAIPPLGTVPLGIASWPLTVFFLVWASNVYNFMDGMDALAAGSGALFFGTLAALAFMAARPDWPTGWVCVFGVAACLGFLVVNVPPAKIFMGDGGALYIGAFLGGLAVILPQKVGAGVPFASCIFAMGSFMWDATYTLGMRIVRREKWNLPHKRHLFQRLVTAGWSHGGVRQLYAALGFFGSAAALATARGPLLLAALGFGAAVLLLVGTSVLAETLEGRKSS